MTDYDYDVIVVGAGSPGEHCAGEVADGGIRGGEVALVAAAVGDIQARFSVTVPVSEVSNTATYTHSYAESKGFLTLLSGGERLTGAYALGPEAGEWLQQATLAIRARVPLPVLRDVIQPFPTFSGIYVAALKALRSQIMTPGQPVTAGSR